LLALVGGGVVFQRDGIERESQLLLVELEADSACSRSTRFSPPITDCTRLRVRSMAAALL
jgi:hypothetical protein